MSDDELSPAIILTAKPEAFDGKNVLLFARVFLVGKIFRKIEFAFKFICIEDENANENLEK